MLMLCSMLKCLLYACRKRSSDTFVRVSVGFGSVPVFWPPVLGNRLRQRSLVFCTLYCYDVGVNGEDIVGTVGALRERGIRAILDYSTEADKKLTDKVYRILQRLIVVYM